MSVDPTLLDIPKEFLVQWIKDPMIAADVAGTTFLSNLPKPLRADIDVQSSIFASKTKRLVRSTRLDRIHPMSKFDTC